MLKNTHRLHAEFDFLHFWRSEQERAVTSVNANAFHLSLPNRSDLE
jgi:hypothetical protein